MMVSALSNGQEPNNPATIYRISSAHTCFPELNRINGYTNDQQFFDFQNHYTDSSVLLVVPAGFHAENGRADLIFWFHGWHNNIDTALRYYHLDSQFIASHKNAVLVLAEAAKNAADSYGGKLEQSGQFSELVNDVLSALVRNKRIPRQCGAGNVLLAGHSGAYRVIAYILQNGGVQVQEVELFDALYSEKDKFMAWMKMDTNHRFINMYTNKGGTDEVSIGMIKDLEQEQVPMIQTEEDELNGKTLIANKTIFIHSKREHNDIIFNPDNFRLFLETSPFLRPTKQP
jgi:hypothetical protein